MDLRVLVPEAQRWLRPARLPAELAGSEAEVTGPCPFRAPALETLLERLGALRAGLGSFSRYRPMGEESY